MPFSPLHLHTDASLLDGACAIDALIPRAKALGYTSLGISDHGTMANCAKFHRVCLDAGIRPILGAELYVIQNKEDKDKPCHLCLYAMSLEGYSSLCQLCSLGYRNMRGGKPRVSWEQISSLSAGLLCTTACLGGLPARYIKDDLPVMAQDAFSWLLSTFEGRLYIELQEHGIEGERAVMDVLEAWAKEHGVPCVAGVDSHYLLKEHAEAHDTMISFLGPRGNKEKEDRWRFPTGSYHLLSEEEARAQRDDPGWQEACSNTVTLAERIEQYALPSDRVWTECEDARGLLISKTMGGMERRYGKDWRLRKDVCDRARTEIRCIDSLGFSSYFLCVADFVQHARLRDITVGPGRGSGAGSLVAYCLEITDIDPLEWGLLFERFLNPDRVSPPDFDIDFEPRRREEVIDYVREKYGEECVARIGTYTTLQTKDLVRRVGSTYGVPYNIVKNYMATIPTGAKLPDLYTERKMPPWLQPRLPELEALYGLRNGAGQHACGVLISRIPIAERVPLHVVKVKQKGKKEKKEVLVTQYEAEECEAMGMLKMDFLGLTELSVIEDTCKHVGLQPRSVPHNDPAALRLIGEGHTVGLFQLESEGMTSICSNMKPTSIEHVCAIIALYRPGPMEWVGSYVARHNGTEPISYFCPELEPILRSTYGIIIYQEQVMQIATVVAGYSNAQADILRKAMGKKKPEVMAKLYPEWKDGCAEVGILTSDEADNLWVMLGDFAQYAFNKSHAMAYAHITMQTAFLKAHHPIPFMTAKLNSEMGDIERRTILIRECQRMSIPLYPPHTGTSLVPFAPYKDGILFGLQSILGVGEGCGERIVQAREDGPFTSLFDFCKRASINAKELEALASVGALDWTGLHRAQMCADKDIIEKRIKADQKAEAKAGNTPSLFDLSEASIPLPTVPVEPWPEETVLARERKHLGMFMSGHPLKKFRTALDKRTTHSIVEAGKAPEKTRVTIGGLASYELIKKKSTWAVVHVEDEEGNRVKTQAFATTLAKEPHIHQCDGRVVVVEGTVNEWQGNKYISIWKLEIV